MAKRTKQTARQRLDEANQACLRTVGVVDLASLVATEAFECSLDRDAEDMCDFLMEETSVPHPSAVLLKAALCDAADECGGSLDLVGEYLVHRNLLGFAVHFATPVMTRTGAHSWSFSWGYTHGTWVCAETYDDAWKLGLAWAEEQKAQSEPAPKARASRTASAA